MKCILTLFVCLFLSLSLSAQKRGIGIRLGDPMGITYKKYFGMRSIELVLGSASQQWHDNYYINAFETRGKYDGYLYRSHRVRSTLYFQARYLVHNAIYVEGMQGKWDWYWGLGGLLKAASVRYNYTSTDQPISRSETTGDIDLGPEGIAGMEYKFDEIPLTVFGEVSLMLEIVDRVTIRPFAGLGARYSF